MSMKTITGYVEIITFRNEENGYTVLTMSVGKKDVKVTGVFGYIGEGEYIEVEGEEVFHPVFGEQIKMKSYKTIPANDEYSIRKYLGSGAIKGLGLALADRIVDKFKEDTFRIVDEEPERLEEVRGISYKKAMDIASQIQAKKDIRDAMIFLQKYGISSAMSLKIYNYYGEEIYQIIKKNPYRIADEIRGIGFTTADEIAKRAGVEVNASIRVKSGMVYALSKASESGHTYLPKENLIQATISFLGLRDQYQNADGTYNMDLLDNYFIDLVMEKKLIVKEINEVQAVFLSTYYYTEMNVAGMLLDLDLSMPADEFVESVKLDTIQRKNNIVLDDLQKEAVMATQSNGVVILTGGPGTGKTTTINAIIQMFESDNLEISLAAPTGRAAKRMTETTGCQAQTIHRLLEINGSTGTDDSLDMDAKFERNETNPIEADVIIIDEMSMVDIFLMHSLLKAVAHGTRLVLVGDINQLASVGPGNVLKDIIDSGKFKVVTLNKIFRQAGESGIVTNAHKINEGKAVELDNSTKDFLYIRRNTPQEALNATIGLIMTKLPDYVKSTPQEIQVLTPMKSGILGVENMNVELQKYINKPDKYKKEHEFGKYIFREGDKVMQIKNNYQIEWEVRLPNGACIDSGKGVFNGDLGIIKNMNNDSQILEVEFDENKMVTYTFKEAEELELAYAITIHKSQGSEYPAVIMPLVTGYQQLMTRNLLYTGITRAKSCVCIVGREDTFQGMIKNEDQHKRYSGLQWQLQTFETEEEPVENDK